MKDFTNPYAYINISEFEALITSHKYFDIYTELGSFEKLLLHMEKTPKQWDTSKSQTFKANYDNLKSYVVNLVELTH